MPPGQLALAWVTESGLNGVIVRSQVGTVKRLHQPCHRPFRTRGRENHQGVAFAFDLGLKTKGVKLKIYEFDRFLGSITFDAFGCLTFVKSRELCLVPAVEFMEAFLPAGSGGLEDEGYVPLDEDANVRM
jgi:hypothetical protein